MKNRLSDKKILDTILYFTPLKKAGECSDIVVPAVFWAQKRQTLLKDRLFFGWRKKHSIREGLSIRILLIQSFIPPT